jgi:hypothetical protein
MLTTRPPKSSFEHPSVHHQEDLYMQFCGISFMHPYKRSGGWQDVFDTIKYSIDNIEIVLILILY